MADYYTRIDPLASAAAENVSLFDALCRAGDALGLRWSRDPFESGLLFLGYPNYGLEPIAHTNGRAWTGDRARLHTTYAVGGRRRCDGDLRFLLEGRHSPLTAAALATGCADLVLPANRIAHALLSLAAWPGASSLLQAPLAPWANLS